MMAYSKAQGRATKKYADTHYKRYTVSLRKDEDAEIIENVKKALESGYTLTEWLRGLYEGRKIV